MTYCCAVQRNRESTVAGKPVAVRFFLQQWIGWSLPLNHLRDNEAAVVRDVEWVGGGS